MPLTGAITPPAARKRPLGESETELLSAACHGGRQERADLVHAFMPLIVRAARTYSHAPAVERGELIQEGVVGVLRALDRYDPRQGTPFWAYASWWVRQAMQQLVSEMSRPLVLSDRALRQLARVRGARRQFARERLREPTLHELARASDLGVSQLQRLLAVERRPRALEEPLDGAGGTITFGELIRDPRAEDAFEELHTRLTAAQVPRLLERLSKRERLVIEGRYGLGVPVSTLGELGRSMGLSAERIRQIEQAALEKMRGGPTGAPSARRPARTRRGHGGRTRPRQPARRTVAPGSAPA
jgi:RNA polymerase sigma factor (sigma-70 family)